MVADLGASFGRTGNFFCRSKGVMKDYEETKFVEKVTPDHVDFVMHSRPFFLTIFDFPNYRFRTRMESVAKNIPIADARWLGNRLGQFSPAQIRRLLPRRRLLARRGRGLYQDRDAAHRGAEEAIAGTSSAPPEWCSISSFHTVSGGVPVPIRHF